jgi:uncharacterized protein YozE (UPF0346 family)
MLSREHSKRQEDTCIILNLLFEDNSQPQTENAFNFYPRHHTGQKNFLNISVSVVSSGIEHHSNCVPAKIGL